MISDPPDLLGGRLRRIAERLSHGVVFKRRLPNEFGRVPIFVSPDVALKYYRPNYAKTESVLFRMAAELVQERSVIWDIGANVGLFAFAAAVRAGSHGHVVAVEPDEWLISLLHRSAALTVPSRAYMTVISAAISDSVGLAQLHIAKRGRSANFLEGAGSFQTGGSRETRTVITLTLDWMLNHLPSPDVVKIDVEGMEHYVLSGAARLLSDVRPKIWCEVSPENAENVAQVFRAADYEIFTAFHNSSERKALSRASWETLAFPREVCVERRPIMEGMNIECG